MHKGLALRENDQGIYDLALEADGNLEMVTGAEAVGQHGRQRLMAFFGEWFLDTTVGVRWLQDIMGRQYDPALSEALTKAEILDTDGVTEITGFSVSFTRELRGMSIRDITVGTIYDEVSL